MSKITFRADDDLVSRLEGLEASKSEVMREALRTHLDSMERESTQSNEREDLTIDELVTDRVDQLLAERNQPPQAPRRSEPRSVPDINVNVSLEGATADNASVDREPTRRKTADPAPHSQPDATNCAQCGETVDDDHVYCPNCGEKATHRLFCECGDEIQSDWGFCPSCGRRTPAANVLDNS